MCFKLKPSIYLLSPCITIHKVTKKNELTKIMPRNHSKKLMPTFYNLTIEHYMNL